MDNEGLDAEASKVIVELVTSGSAPVNPTFLPRSSLRFRVIGYRGVPLSVSSWLDSGGDHGKGRKTLCSDNRAVRPSVHVMVQPP